MRKRGEGKAFAFAVFDQFSGPWQVRQIENADLAKKFWREIIDEYSGGNYEEQAIDDSLWGKATCQRCTSRKKS